MTTERASKVTDLVTAQMVECEPNETVPTGKEDLRIPLEILRIEDVEPEPDR